MEIDLDAAVFEALAELLRGDLSRIARNHHAAEEKAEALEVVDELERVVRVGDAEVGAHLLVLDVARVDAEDDLGLVLEGLEEAELHVGVVAREAARGVEVVHELPAELEVELAVLRGAAADLLALLGEVLLVVEADLHFAPPLISSRMAWIFGLHLPQPPPAFVKLVTSSTVVREFSVITRRTSFSLTL